MRTYKIPLNFGKKSCSVKHLHDRRQNVHVTMMHLEMTPTYAHLRK